jgi:hypothetical protein
MTATECFGCGARRRLGFRIRSALCGFGAGSEWSVGVEPVLVRSSCIFKWGGRARATGGPRKIECASASACQGQDRAGAPHEQIFAVALRIYVPDSAARWGCSFVGMALLLRGASWPSRFSVLRIPARAARPASNGETTGVDATVDWLALPASNGETTWVDATMGSPPRLEYCAWSPLAHAPRVERRGTLASRCANAAAARRPYGRRWRA